MFGPTLLAAAALASGTVTFGGDFFVRDAHQVQRLGEGPVVVNLEGTLCRAGASARKVKGEWKLCLDEKRTLRALKQAGVAAVVLANNHTDDEGDKGRARLEAALAKAGIGVIDETRAWCHKDDEGELCVVGIRYEDDPEREGDDPAVVGTKTAEAKLRAGARVVVVEHYDDLWGVDEMEEPAAYTSFGPGVPPPAAILGVGGHEARVIHASHWDDDDEGFAPYFRDLGDVVVDCACSRGQVGMLVDIPVAPTRPVRARLIRAQHGKGPIGHPPDKDTLARRLLESVASGSTAYVIDDHVELWRVRSSSSSKPASMPASQPAGANLERPDPRPRPRDRKPPAPGRRR
jgi:hypothetical protein